MPGVKLRPAAPSKAGISASKQKEQPSWLDTTGEDFDVSEIIKSSRKPFQGIVICASSIADKVRRIGTEFESLLTALFL